MTPPALIVVDVQRAFEDPAWGRRNNPDSEANIAALVAHWRERGWPLVLVRHDSTRPTRRCVPSCRATR